MPEIHHARGIVSWFLPACDFVSHREKTVATAPRRVLAGVPWTQRQGTKARMLDHITTIHTEEVTMMRKLSALRALVIAMLCLIPALLAGSSGAWADAEEVPPGDSGDNQVAGDDAGELYVIGTDTTFAPFEFRDPSGELVGIDIDIMTAIAENQGFQVEFRSMGFNAALQALSSNQVDGVIAGMGITDERQEVYDFSDPYFTGELTIAANEGSGITGWEDLEGETVAVKTGSLSEEWAQEMQEDYDFELNSLDQTTSLVESVKAGHDAALVDDLPIIAYGIQQGSGLELVSDPEPAGDYGFAVNKGENQELLTMFNEGLQEIQASGEYDEILDRYLGEDAEGPDNSTFICLLQTSLPALMIGLGNTLAITGISFAMAMVLGLVFGFLKVSSNIVLRGIATTYVNLFRGTPVLVWAFFFYFGLPQLIQTEVNIWVAGALTLSLNAGAYIAEIVRGGIQSVDSGQQEAARSLALTSGQSMRYVVLPQAFKIMTPSLINQLVIMIKDSSLLLAIGFGELLYQAQQIYAANFRVTEVLAIAGLIYFIAIYLLTKLANFVDKKVNH
ncbi:ABC transporter substrate-binding protein/permease [Auritidibacter ignavus]|uniref:ABC transporter substrate-binding protein/permease n=1 Tax=Auritidibacter ignavus TaxID=678932 RepID=UPI00244B7553|nr:ABC transporter substrate-binding protein/permease [Auritidibacter ignavus]WGH86181.1 ABC transporter substrate-binding protein/permease [Auritidibacter ignavus]WGH88465.1 ABC transporter substrate-binding protein/permease [Auritidibacter ignavus]